MNVFMKFMEEKFVPVAAKIGSQRHLVAVRDGFIGIMPITMVGSIAVLLNVFFRDIPNNYGFPQVAEKFSWLININGIVWFGSIAILAFAFVFALGYSLSASYQVNALAGGLVAFSSFVVFLPQTASFEAEINGVKDMVEAWGYISLNYLGAGGLFTAVIVGLVSTMIYSKLMLNKVTIKLPDTVPPAVSNSIASIIPGVVAVYVSAIFSHIITATTGKPFNDLVSMYIQKPLLGLSQGLVSVIIIVFMIQFFWFFGMHGHNVLAPILESVYQPALLENVDHIAQGGTISTLPYMWTRGSFDAYLQMGGSGITIALIIAIFIFSKKEEEKAIAKLALPMGVFNINEPIIFGLPIVLNPLMFIPFILSPVVSAVIAYIATKIGLIPPVYVQVPWILPPGIYALLATGGNFMAALVSLFNVFISFLIYTPFVIMSNKDQK